MLGKE